MAYVAALFSTSIRLPFEDMFSKGMGFVVFRFFFATLWKTFAFSLKF